MLSENNFDLAVIYYTLALDYAPNNAALLANRSKAYLKHTPSKNNEALQDALSATEANPSLWIGWSSLGDVKLGMGDAYGAVQAFDKAIQLGGDEVDLATRNSRVNAIRQLDQDRNGLIPI